MSFKTNDAPDQDQDQATTTLAHGGCLCLTDVTVKDSSGRVSICIRCGDEDFPEECDGGKMSI